MLFHLGYVIAQTRLSRGPEVAALLQIARTFHDAHGVTGLFLCREGSFLAVLEGE